MENISDIKQRFRSIVSEIQKSVECPVCLETVKTPFKVCARGHGVCLECMVKLEKCPLCQQVFTSENSVCLKNVLAALPRFCRYSDAGCEEFVESGNDHEMFCGYRPIMCLFPKCSVTVPLVEFESHSKTQHSNWFIFDKLTCTTSLWNPAGKGPAYNPVYIFKNWFWILLMIDTEKQLRVFFLATPMGKLEHDYYARVKLKNGEFVYTYTLKAQALSSCEEPVSSNVFSKELLDDEYCMKVPENELSKFKNDKGQLRSTYSFFRV